MLLLLMLLRDAAATPHQIRHGEPVKIVPVVGCVVREWFLVGCGVKGSSLREDSLLSASEALLSL
jgi:hypothetical protein